MNTPPKLERLYRVEEVAKLLSLSRSTVHHLCAHGRIATVRIGRAVRIRESELLRVSTEGCAPTRSKK